MNKRKRAPFVLLLLAGSVFAVHPAPSVEALAGPGLEMTWMPTANWLGCDQNGPAPECADYGTPSGSFVQLTCCVPVDALGTSDPSACTGAGAGRGRTEL